MAGEKAFQEVLHFVAKSKLNFSILQTPFSAQLSLKKSFSKNIHEDHSDFKEVIEESDETDTWKRRINKLENRLIAVNLENLKLKKELEEHKESICNLENECKTMEGNLKIEKKRIKKERQRVEKQEIRVKVENVKNVEKEENEVDVDVPNVPTNNRFETLQNAESDPRKDVKECASQTDVFECDICSVNFIMETSLKEHIISKHKSTSESETQTSMISKISAHQRIVEQNEYAKYQCFYCEKEIGSKVQLKEHRVTCQGATENPSLFSFPVRSLYKCVICGLVTFCKADMLDHKKSVHGNQ